MSLTTAKKHSAIATQSQPTTSRYSLTTQSRNVDLTSDDLAPLLQAATSFARFVHSLLVCDRMHPAQYNRPYISNSNCFIRECVLITSIHSTNQTKLLGRFSGLIIKLELQFSLSSFSPRANSTRTTLQSLKTLQSPEERTRATPRNIRSSGITRDSCRKLQPISRPSPSRAWLLKGTASRGSSAPPSYTDKIAMSE